MVDSAVNALTQVWFGADLQHFHGTWQGSQKGQASSAAQDLHTAVGELRREVARAATDERYGGSVARIGSHGLGAFSGRLGGQGERGGFLDSIRSAWGKFPIVGLLSSTKDFVKYHYSTVLHDLPGTGPAGQRY